MITIVIKKYAGKFATFADTTILKNVELVKRIKPTLFAISKEINPCLYTKIEENLLTEEELKRLGAYKDAFSLEEEIEDYNLQSLTYEEAMERCIL